MNLLKTTKIVIIIGLAVTLMACSRVFEFSPYKANVKDRHRNNTAKNLQLIEDIEVASDNFKFAFVSDSHFHFDNLKTVIHDINKKGDILFVIFGGDMADQGLLKEYELFYNIVKKLHKPYLTVIGNHDYKSNGGIIYQQMFGDFNYSFEFNNNKFVLFDNIVWESNKNPDFDWLYAQLSDNASQKQLFVIAHIPPFTDQLDSTMQQRYHTLLSDNNVELSMHGHIHSYSYAKTFDDAVNYLTVPSLKKKSYCIVNVHNKSFDIELIEL